MNLAQAGRDQRLRVVGVRAATAATTRRLQELGIRSGAMVSIQRHTAGGGAIVAIGDDRLAMARSLLRGVAVVPADPHPDEPAGPTDGGGSHD